MRSPNGLQFALILLCAAMLGVSITWSVAAYADCKKAGGTTTFCLKAVLK